MTIVRSREVVEFVGGPADGTRTREPIDPETDRPANVRVWSHVIRTEDGPAVHTDVLYELREAPDDREPFWRYVLPGSSEDFGFDPDDDSDYDDENAQER